MKCTESHELIYILATITTPSRKEEEGSETLLYLEKASSLVHRINIGDFFQTNSLSLYNGLLAFTTHFHSRLVYHTWRMMTVLKTALLFLTLCCVVQLISAGEYFFSFKRFRLQIKTFPEEINLNSLLVTSFWKYCCNESTLSESFPFSATGAMESANSVCCFKEANSRIPLKMLKSYYWTSSSCPLRHIVWVSSQ